MKRFVSSCMILGAIAVLIAPGVAHAATKANTAKAMVGYDVSYPQCHKKVPAQASFVIVGVNGGNAANTNPCLAEQLSWAKKVTEKSSSKQPKIQLYVNTANPGENANDIATWPKSNFDEMGYDTTSLNPYGLCLGGNNLACSWQYGWNRAVEAALDRFAPAATQAGISKVVADYTWWLDVETVNTWQRWSTEAHARNTASLEGMAMYFQVNKGGVGLYSTAVQWAEITGNTPSKALAGLPNWRPSGSVLNNAVINCHVAPLTDGGSISLTQYVQGGIDKNHSCI